ncbi:hypothetical protein BAUCODRAFT_330923 [Baudoinia panamericana UAMH 10762]|uniref:Uncharacterized protein n=1 Tax=Baudoinia panamericana (strain UAMH 10762) TaxID=717646 RepID=M2MHZ8_BAUPA|nr:uncharacterized protein BAUCODRAFT_330923 [Baudoinia panamericana UAMH 10762]EMC90888.1 hypothetical protein BAUCODRAFT_330923 [Baudoinia panamericana UAMH 10762]
MVSVGLRCTVCADSFRPYQPTNTARVVKHPRAWDKASEQISFSDVGNKSNIPEPLPPRFPKPPTFEHPLSPPSSMSSSPSPSLPPIPPTSATSPISPISSSAPPAPPSPSSPPAPSPHPLHMSHPSAASPCSAHHVQHKSLSPKPTQLNSHASQPRTFIYVHCWCFTRRQRRRRAPVTRSACAPTASRFTLQA